MPPRREPPPSNGFDPELLVNLLMASRADDLQPPLPDFDEAIKFVNKVKTTFEGQIPYREFLDLLQKFKEDSITVVELFTKVSDLFKHHNDLLSGFMRFLPTEIAPKTNMDRAD